MSLNDQLEAFWELDEASGSRADSSGNGRTLTDNNTVTQATGKVGSAAQFTAANSEYLSRADEAGISFGNESFTISVWIYGDTWTGAQREIINKNTTEWRLRVTNAGRPTFSLPSTTLTHSATLSLSTWYHLVAKYDADTDTMSLIVNNGTPETASDSAGATNGTNELRVGRLGTAYFDGRIDALGLWRRALSADEITQLYNAGSGIEPPFATTHEATGALVGPALLAGSPVVLVPATASLVSPGMLSGSPVVYVPAAADLVGAGLLAGSGTVVVEVSVELVASGAAAAAGGVIAYVTADLAAVGGLAGLSSVLLQAEAALAAAGLLVASATITRVIPAGPYTVAVLSDGRRIAVPTDGRIVVVPVR